MTRINLVLPAELCDQHLLAEHRELTRIPNYVLDRVVTHDLGLNLENRPADYTLGTGHVRFFYDRLGFLHDRYSQLYEECRTRGFNVQWNWPADAAYLNRILWQDYIPTALAMGLNRERISLRMPARARFTPRKVAA